MENPITTGKTHSSTGPLKKLEDFLELYLVKKAPYTLPPKAKEFFVKLAPWGNIFAIILVLPLILILIGIQASFSSLFYFYSGTAYYLPAWTWQVLAIAQVVLLIIALPGLFKRTKSGWKWMFYAEIVMVVYGLMSLNLSSIIGYVLSMYFLFQIKDQYHD